MAETYRARVTHLIYELGAHGEYNETWEALRALIDKIVVTPSAPGGHQLELITMLKKTKPAEEAGIADLKSSLDLVAGVGFEPTTFRL